MGLLDDFLNKDWYACPFCGEYVTVDVHHDPPRLCDCGAIDAFAYLPMDPSSTKGEAPS